MKKELLEKLRKTTAVTLPNAVVRDLNEQELTAVVGGKMARSTDTCSCGCYDDCPV